jgi:predicted porin
MQLESGFSVDTGVSAQGGRLFGRQAYTGLSGGFGTVAMGRIAAFSSGTGAFDMYGDIDPFGTSYSNTGNLGNTQSSANSLRLDNAAVWRSPNWRGATLGAGYSFRTNGTENPGGSDANNAVTFLGASYGAGPVYLALTYDIMKLGEVAGDPKQKNLQIGGTYDLKFLKLHAAYAKEDNVHPTVVASTAQQAAGSDADAWMIGLSAPFGAHKLLGSYQKRNVDRFGATPEGDREIWAIAYEYRFTRRSVFYATYGDRKDEGSLRTATSGGQKALGAGFMHLF